VIDLGPEGGDGGGEIVAAGPPEAVAKEKRSHTGRFLAEVLARRPMASSASVAEAPPPRRSGRRRAAE
jgi:excinuclease ABC subunit A